MLSRGREVGWLLQLLEYFVCHRHFADSKKGFFDNRSDRCRCPEFLQVSAQIKFTEWTDDDQLPQPLFLGLRSDKHAKEVVREQEHPCLQSVNRLPLIASPGLRVRLRLSAGWVHWEVDEWPALRSRAPRQGRLRKSWSATLEEGWAAGFFLVRDRANFLNGQLLKCFEMTPLVF